MGSWRPTGSQARGLVRSLLTSYVALGVTLYVLPGRQSSGPWSVLGLVAAVALVGTLLRPLLARLALVLGPFGLLLLGVLSQAVILDVAIALAPDLRITGPSEVILTSWVAALVAAVVNWALDAGSEDVFLSQTLRHAVRVSHREHGKQGKAPSPAPGGLLIVQLDGVSEPLLRQAIAAGDVPSLSSWLNAGTHRLRGWHTGLPATTPAGQAVLLHGDVTAIPSFRWYEKKTGVVRVANHPRDAAEIQRRLSDGNGLLANGGVSVSNLFSGDAPIRLLTVSDAHLPPRNTRGMLSFAAARGALLRSLVGSAGQAATELYQGRRQRQRHVRPRVKRGLLFALQRAVTTGLLRELAVLLVAEQIALGAPVIFVDFLDYDEVAHHAGPSRPESMRTLDGLDRLVRCFAEVAQETRVGYEIAIVSDHGQVQGTTFGQLCGQSLQEVVTLLARVTRPSKAVPPTPSAATIAAMSAWARATSPSQPRLARIRRSRGIAARIIALRDGLAESNLDPSSSDDHVSAAPGLTESSGPTPLVLVAGSLAHLYLTDLPGRVSHESIECRYPSLIAELARHAGIGAVVVRSETDGLRVIGAQGWRRVTESGLTGGVGQDPLAQFASDAAMDVWALDRREHVGDLVLLGSLDPDSGEVTAFEELVGSHGGLGGLQTSALFLHPSSWLVPDHADLTGLDVHQILREHVPQRERVAQP